MAKVTVPALRAKKVAGEKIAVVTCYDATFARLMDATDVDIFLVGDSVGMVVQGHDTTLPVTLDEMVYHTRAVARGTARAQVVADMPFMSYQTSIEDGLRAAGRLVKEGAAEAVKIEGGAQHAALVARLVGAGIPVMGHLGLTPQSVHQLGGFKVQGKDATAAKTLLADAKALEAAGAYSLVLEGIPRELARDVTAAVGVPTIGIGAGPDCDGQVLVLHDLLGLETRFQPKFVRRYESLADKVAAAVSQYAADVRAGTFPSDQESFHGDSGAKGTGAGYGAARRS